MMLKLRRDWYEEQAGKPSLRAFHDEVLASGAVPLDVVEARVKAWVERAKPR